LRLDDDPPLLPDPFEDLPLPEDDPARGGGDELREVLGRDGGLEARGEEELGEELDARGGGDVVRGALVAGGAERGELVAGGEYRGELVAGGV